jgi:hypothetical protein
MEPVEDARAIPDNGGVDAASDLGEYENHIPKKDDEESQIETVGDAEVIPGNDELEID